ncbi:hypothetical protein SAMN05444156_1285 [Verrucomicrobium sp. GAS474]|uniref:hypothetical protein n=1 Tax=Verrucomicrobium sp. GAS474 TaxID=1882831 RepID=UPI00087B62D3|nr:hypothetical protein [Verrucomicrobium sp. GAS474]SDT98940.1 hypothetical protein SAMN05444156_1285 [Verrucomicrobium sp. GAS474]
MSDEIPMNPSVRARAEAEGDYGTYTPGYARSKAVMIAVGLCIMGFGFSQLVLPLRLLAFGGRARAEAVAVVKEKEGLPPGVLRSDAEIAKQLEPRDRSYTFWNTFRFRTREGVVVEVRAPVGSQLKPLYALIDEEGLPTGDLVWYDKACPETVVFPLIVSTWFAPVMIVLGGALTVFVGSFLFYWANRPIALPRIGESS